MTKSRTSENKCLNRINKFLFQRRRFLQSCNSNLPNWVYDFPPGIASKSDTLGDFSFLKNSKRKKDMSMKL